MRENSMQTLSQRLRRKASADQKQHQELIESALRTLRGDLKRQLRDASHSIGNDIDRDLKSLRRWTRHLRIHSFLVSLLAALTVLLVQVAWEGRIPQWLGQEIQGMTQSRQEGSQIALLEAKGIRILEGNGRTWLRIPMEIMEEYPDTPGMYWINLTGRE